MLIKILAYFIIPAYTLLFTKGYNWFTTNFSVIGNIDKKLAFLIWGVMVGVYFYLNYKRIKSLTRLSPLCSGLIPAALALLFCAITTPYLPEELPLKAFLHILFALMAAVLLLLFLLLLPLSQYRRAPRRFRPFLFGWAGIVGISAVLLNLAGIVSSALEIFITVTTVIMTDRLAEQIRKSALTSGFAPPAGRVAL